MSGMSVERLSRALDEAQQYIRATDDPRNHCDSGLMALKLLVVFIESQQP